MAKKARILGLTYTAASDMLDSMYRQDQDIYQAMMGLLGDELSHLMSFTWACEYGHYWWPDDDITSMEELSSYIDFLDGLLSEED